MITVLFVLGHRSHRQRSPLGSVLPLTAITTGIFIADHVIHRIRIVIQNLRGLARANHRSKPPPGTPGSEIDTFRSVARLLPHHQRTTLSKVALVAPAECIINSRGGMLVMLR